MTVSVEGSSGADCPHLAVSLYTYPQVRVLKLVKDDETSFLVFVFIEYRRDSEPPRTITKKYLKERGTLSYLQYLQLPDVAWYGESKEVNAAATAYFCDQQTGTAEYILQQIAKRLGRIDPKGHLEQSSLQKIP